MSRYNDIITLPHHVSINHPQMSMHDRATQFAPFSALVGYNDAVAEATRQTEKRPELDEQEQREINAILCTLAERSQDHQKVRIRFFVPDKRKADGIIVDVKSVIKKLVTTDKIIVLNDGTVIPISDLIEIELDK